MLLLHPALPMTSHPTQGYSPAPEWVEISLGIGPRSPLWHQLLLYYLWFQPPTPQPNDMSLLAALVLSQASFFPALSPSSWAFLPCISCHLWQPHPIYSNVKWSLLRWLIGKESTCQCRRWRGNLVGFLQLRRQYQISHEVQRGAQRASCVVLQRFSGCTLHIS